MRSKHWVWDNGAANKATAKLRGEGRARCQQMPNYGAKSAPTAAIRLTLGRQA